MKLKNSYFFTHKEDAKDEDSISGNLLVRSGMIRKVGSGIYMTLPLGHLVLTKLENIIREEMNKAGAAEMLQPLLVPIEYYEKTNRRTIIGDGMFESIDRYNKEYALGPTHEEMFAVAAKLKVKSYKDLPFNLYQIATKFRDEIRPRFGLVRVREFKMKDAYSFDKDLAGLDESYEIMYKAYQNIYDRLGLDYVIVKASTGIMGGILSEEFQALTNKGEDTIVLCKDCDFASNIEIAATVPVVKANTEKKQVMTLVETPNVKKVEDVADFFDTDPSKIVKTITYLADGEVVAFMIPGHLEINEEKISQTMELKTLELCDAKSFAKVSDTDFGFVGPIGLKCRIIIDHNVLNMTNFVMGAGINDQHYQNANLSDFEYDEVMDLTEITEGSECPKCNGTIYFKRGIEVGNTFKLGTKYAEDLDLYYSTAENKLAPVVMGSYGIGIGRTLAAIIEQNHDEQGMILPEELAPFRAGIVLINEKDETAVNLANELYDHLNSKGIDTVLDNRDERAGIKFKDMELIGIPWRITVGKHAADGNVELFNRRTGETQLIDKEALYQHFQI